MIYSDTRHIKNEVLTMEAYMGTEVHFQALGSYGLSYAGISLAEIYVPEYECVFTCMYTESEIGISIRCVANNVMPYTFERFKDKHLQLRKITLFDMALFEATLDQCTAPIQPVEVQHHTKEHPHLHIVK